MSLKGFVNRFSHYCHIDIDRDASTVHCMSSSVLQLFNNRRNLGRTKNIDTARHKLHGLFYHEEHRSGNSLKSFHEKKKSFYHPTFIRPGCIAGCASYILSTLRGLVKGIADRSNGRSLQYP